MLKKTNLLIMVILLVMSTTAFSADTKVNGRLYAHWMLDKTDGADNANEFGIGRAYVTVKSKLSDYTSLRITTDIKETEIDGKTRYDIILKYAYFDWKPAFGQGILKVRFGLQATPYIDMMNKVWSRRYLEKTVTDLNKYLTSSDLGVGAYVGLGEKGKYGTAGLIVFNGTSYSNLGEENKQKDFNFYTELTPFADNPDLKNSTIVGQYYYGFQNEMIPDSVEATDYKNQLFSIAGNLAYQSLINVGGELNFRTVGNGTGMEDTKESAFSFFGTLYLEQLLENTPALRTLNLFGRVDIVDPDTDVDENKENLAIFGVECTPVKGFKASVNYRKLSFDDTNETTEKGLYFNTLFKF